MKDLLPVTFTYALPMYPTPSPPIFRILLLTLAPHCLSNKDKLVELVLFVNEYISYPFFVVSPPAIIRKIMLFTDFENSISYSVMVPPPLPTAGPPAIQTVGGVLNFVPSRQISSYSTGILPIYA